MSEQIILPDLGMDMEEALLITWTKSVGDSISKGDVIAEVETDKTTVEVEAQVAGTILEFTYDPGDEMKIGDVIGYVGEAGEAAPSGGGASAAPAPAKEEKTEAAPAPASAASNGTGSASTTDTGRVKISPVARRIADDRGIDIAQMGAGSGPGGRIIKADVENYTPPAAPAPTPAPQAAPAPAAMPSNVGTLAGPSYGKLPAESDSVHHEDMSKIRTRIAERMVTSKQQMPQFYVTMECQVDDLLALRKQLNADEEDRAKKISVNDMIVKAVAMAARDVPNVNRHYYGDRYVKYDDVNVGIAVALDGGGLMNVVCRNADRISLRVMAIENRERIMKARDGKVQPKDITGSTITVSNLGMYGVDNFIAIVTPPEAAIVAVGAAKQTPVVRDDGTIGVATMLKLTLSADHRTVNGAEGGEYMAALREYIENPMRLL